MSPNDYYLQQKNRYTIALNQVVRKINNASRLRFWLIVLAIVAGICAFRSGSSWEKWLTLTSVIAFIAVVRRHIKFQDQKDIISIHLLLIDNELKGLSGDISHFPEGNSHISTAHPYSYDLDIFGKGSVYQLLCRTVTNGGAILLAGQLQSLTLTKESITLRQAIIKELASRPELLQQFRVAGTAVPEGGKDQMLLKEWLNGKDHFLNKGIIRVAAMIMPVLSLACIVWSVYSGTVYSGLSLVIAINWILLGSFQKRIKEVVQQIGNTASFIDKYTGLLTEISAAEFTASQLQGIAANAKASVNEIKNFKKMIHLFESRSNGMVGPLMNTFFLFDFYCLLKLEAWRKKHYSVLLKAIDDMIAVDVYVSCGVYAFNHPASIYPEINTDSLEIKAADLRHPLLSSAVGNEMSLGKAEQFYLLTGANMTGKSTFIRTIGVSNVLANLGLPLPAASLSLPLLDLYTSMRITDSVQDDISYFRAELNRIKNIMDMVQWSKQHYLILLDEPLRGTNSTDKQQGTRAIVENLLTCNAIGIVATHDTSLADMENSSAGRVSNYHFESQVSANALTFDFKLQRGVSTSNNATILMRQMGIVK